MRHLLAFGFVVLACLLRSPAGAATTADGVVLINQSAANAGSVTPGDVAGFPVEIKVGGSYRLSSDLVVPADQNGIYVTARNVTIDLNGFTIRGGGVARNGIRSIMSGLTVTNGTIQNFTQDAIYMAGPQLYVEKTKLLNNGRYGINEIYIAADPSPGEEDGYAIIKNNIIMENQSGLLCMAGCHVEGNVVSYSLYTGVHVGVGSTVINNTITYNGQYGVSGALVGLGGNTIMYNATCHTNSSPILVMEKNAIYPASGTSCPALPGN